MATKPALTTKVYQDKQTGEVFPLCDKCAERVAGLVEFFDETDYRVFCAARNCEGIPIYDSQLR